MARLKEKYLKQIRGELQKKFSYPNPMMIPRMLKVILHMGLAEAAKDKDSLRDAIKEMSLISGQWPIVTKAKKSIANFKLRKGNPVGVKVTLRGRRMYDFLERFFNIICPRIRDFRGFSTKCDGRGNYSLGLEDQQIFLELNLDEIKRAQGMHISFVTTAQSDEECGELLRLLGLPFMGVPVVVTG